MTSRRTPRRLGRPATWTAGHGIQIFFGAVSCWVAGVFLLLTFQPEAGAGSTGALQAAVRSSVTTQDADALARLFVPATVGDEYPAALLTRLQDAGPWRTQVRDVGGRRELVLSAASGCTSWGLTRVDGRWFLDGVPAIGGGCRPIADQ